MATQSAIPVGRAHLRTICNCPTCVEHCRRQPGYLIPSDLEALAEHCGQSVERMASEHLEPGPGSVVGVLDEHTGRLRTWTIPTLVPKRGASGACHWLMPDGRCAVHAVAPYGCAWFDSHMSRAEGDARSIPALRIIQSDREYQQLVRELQ